MSEQKTPRTIIAHVISDRGDKTIGVSIDRQLRHAVYAKYITRSTKLQVHDEANAARIGDVVRIASCRRFSKNKAWQLIEVLQRASDITPTPTSQPQAVEE